MAGARSSDGPGATIYATRGVGPLDVLGTVEVTGNVGTESGELFEDLVGKALSLRRVSPDSVRAPPPFLP